MQIRTTSDRTLSTFESDILEGLTSEPKHLSSKYFYDAEGSRLFQKIMHLPEYYLTKCEYEILDTYKATLLELFSIDGESFDLVELGAGDGLKTKILLRDFVSKNAPFIYQPIDISPKALEGLVNSIQQEIPQLKVEAQEGEYFAVLQDLKKRNKRRKIVLFLGSNIGNLTEKESLGFLTQLCKSLQKGDLLVLGFDLKKHPKVILNAYDDAAKVTSAFNLNLLKRLNREMDADFDLEQFEHYPLYDPEKGEARSYIVSKINQQVYLGAIDTCIDFKAGETIHTEISRKYNIDEIKGTMTKAGFHYVTTFTDERNYFADMVVSV